MKNWAIVVACGPDDREITRVQDVLDSTFHYEPDTRWAVIIDSGEEDRHLADRFTKPAGTTLVAIRNPKSGRAIGNWGPLCVGVMAAYAWVVRNTNARFVVKYDSDALTIAPFADRMFEAMKEFPHAGVFGAYLRDCNGISRDYRGMGALMRRLQQFALFDYQPNRFGRRFPLAVAGRPAGMRRHIRQALQNGYHYGEHVSGGAYGITREMLDRMERFGFFDERYVWADSEMSEDVMFGMYALAVNLNLAGLAATGEVFGVKHKGLPDTPANLVERGYAVIHSVKNDKRISEEEVRGYYRARREADHLRSDRPLRLNSGDRLSATVS